MIDKKFDWDDITIVPEVLSDISSRKEIDIKIDGKLPLFVAPMDMVLDEHNKDLFLDEGYNVCMPRGFIGSTPFHDEFYSYGLDEIINILDENEFLPGKVLIDTANGNMLKLYKTSKRLKEERNIELMVGNIANPETYRKYCEIGVDWVRCGIGGGKSCTTSANTGIHYPMGSLIKECYEVSKEFDIPSKIVADGGFKKYSDIIKALAIGAHSVMLGGIMNKCLESCSANFIKSTNSKSVNGYQEVDNIFAQSNFKDGSTDIYKYYRGMSTKEVQKDWNKKVIKTAEGISMYNKVEYTLSGWTENFSDYLKSNMSYCGKRNMVDYSGKVEIISITDKAFNRFNK